MALDQVDIDKIDLATGKLKDEAEMSFFDHIEELRWHIVRAVAAIVICGIVIFMLGDTVFKNIIFGPKEDWFLSYRAICGLSEAIGFGDRLCFTPPDFQVQAVEFAEAFITHLKVAFIGGFVVAFPYVFYQIWSFIKPGLYENEQKAARGTVFVCSVLFSIGVLFGYFVISPFAVNFLAGYEIPGVVNNPTLSSYVNYLVMFTVPAGIAFELPVVVYFLATIGLISSAFLKQYRKHSVVVILVLAAIITPPDVITQCLIGIPIYFLYEASILIAKRVEKKQEVIITE